MSTNNQDPFEQIIAQEEASQQQLQMLDSLAQELVAKEPATRCKRYGHTIPKTNAVFTLSQTFEDDDPALDGSWVMLQLYRDMGTEETNFIIAFTPHNDLADIHYPAQLDADVALEVVQEFLDSNELDENETLIAKHVESLLFTICFDGKLEAEDDNADDGPIFQQFDFDDHEEYDGHHFGGATDEREIADVIREATDQMMGDQEIHTREFGAQVDTASTITVISREAVAVPKDEPRTVHARNLEVVYSDLAHNLTYVYKVDIEGERKLDILYGDELCEEAAQRPSSNGEDESPEHSSLWSEHVNILLDALATVTADNLDPTDLV